MRFSLFLFLLSLCCASGANRRASLRPIELFVGPNGADSNVGSRSAPLNTLEAARDRLREAGGEGNTITLLHGTYSRSVVFQLDVRDNYLLVRTNSPTTLVEGLQRMKEASARKMRIVPIPFESIGLRQNAERKSLKTSQ
jgi:hypothetical protein